MTERTGFFSKTFGPIARFWTRSIRRQIMLGITLVHAVLMSVFVFDMVERQRDFLNKESIEQAKSLANTLSTNSASWVLANDIAGMDEVIRSIKDYPNLRYAMLISQDGQVLAHSDRSLAGKYLMDPKSLEMLKGAKEPLILNSSRSLVDIATPVIIAEQRRHVGWARIGLGQERIAAGLLLVARHGVYYTAGAIMAGAVFALFISSGLTMGLRRLVDVTDSIREGSRDARAALNRTDELGQLGEGLNLMLDSITASEERVRQLLDSTAEGIFGFDMDEKLIFINTSAMRMLGYSNSAELMGKNIHNMIHCERPNGSQIKEEDCGVFTALHSGTGMHVEHDTFRKRDGGFFDVEFWAFPTRQKGVMNGVVVTFLDITERKKARDAERIHAMELEEINKELAEFAYVASHDLQEPLRTISNYCQFLKKDAGENLTKRAQDDMFFITDAANRMRRLIDDLLQLSRASRTELNFEHSNLTEIAEKTVKDLATRILETKTSVVLGELPVVMADKTLLHRLLLNLMTNAIKFHGDNPPVVKLSSRRVEDKWEISVEDNGIGMENKYFQQIFMPFKRLHGMSKYEGTGIGLAISKKIVERHGGRIWVESKPGLGSKFIFTLPAAD